MRKRNNVVLRIVIFIVFSFFTLLVSGCRSLPKSVAVDPFDVLNDDSSVYVSFPVQSCKNLVAALFCGNVDGLSSANALKIVAHMDRLYAGIGTADCSDRVQFCVSGAMPETLCFVLTERNGWRKTSLQFKRRRSATSYVYYTFGNSQFEISFIGANLVCGAGNVRPLLARYDDKAFGVTGTQQQRTKDSLLDDATVSWLKADSSEIRFCILRPQAFLAKLTGTDMRFALVRARGFFLADAGSNGFMDLTLYMTLQSSEAARAVAALIRIAGNGLEVRKSNADSAELTVENIRISETQLVKLLSR